MSHQPSLSPDTLYRLLSRRDLTDPLQGPHAMQALAAAIHEAVGSLGYPVRYTRLQAVRPPRDGEPPVPQLACGPIDQLEQAALPRSAGEQSPVMLGALGAVHGLDLAGGVRLHGHQLSLWLSDGAAGQDPLPAILTLALSAAVPGLSYRLLPTEDPRLDRVFAVQLRHDDDWVAVGLCGRVAHARLGPMQGLILELDELLALRKGLPDKGLIYSTRAEDRSRMLDLEPWAEASVSRTG